MISIYLFGMLGEFDSDVYIQGYAKKYAMSMFIIATYLIMVVFMNILIVIMGQTFIIICSNFTWCLSQII